MSAAILREAAALMRERAAGATWVDFHGKADWTGDVAALGLDEADEAHIAGMSPVVALAVADLLDEAADHLEDHSGFPVEAVCPTAQEGLDCSVLGQALTVARAYLATP